MKGAIVTCLKELVTKKFGTPKWEAALSRAGIDTYETFLATQDIDDATVMKVVGAVCEELNMTMPQAADAFGEHWMCTYAPRVYGAYFFGLENARDFIVKMDEIHHSVTRNIPNSRPPHFEYSWENDRTLIMKYESKRGLVDFMIGLVKGVGKHYHEDLAVSRVGNDSARIVFH